MTIAQSCVGGVWNISPSEEGKKETQKHSQSLRNSWWEWSLTFCHGNWAAREYSPSLRMKFKGHSPSLQIGVGQ